MTKIWAKTDEKREGKFLVIRRDGTIPQWPHFVMGARDPAAPAALRAYADAAAKLGMDKEYTSSLLELASDFESYRAKEGNGDPDATWHRKDNDNVIAAMNLNVGDPSVRLTVRVGENKDKP